MPKLHSNAKLCGLHYATKQQRIDDARAAAKLAAKLFGAVNEAGNPGGGTTITVTVPGNLAGYQMQNIIDAIDGEDFNDFYNACLAAGLTAADEDLITRLWDATFGSLRPQSVKPCW